MRCAIYIATLTLVFYTDYAKALPASSTFQEAKVNKVLLEYLLSLNTINAAANPAAGSACFAKYLPVLTEIGTTYSAQYAACVTQADKDTMTLINNASSNHTNFMATTSGICTAYKNCNVDTDMLGFFNCYANVSSLDVSLLYTLSTNATNAAATLNGGLRQLNEEKYQCINTTENTYVENTAATYKLLNKCLESTDAAPVPLPTFSPENSNFVHAGNSEIFVSELNASAKKTRIVSSLESSKTFSKGQSQRSDAAQLQCMGMDCAILNP